jgi:hypothetical protein
LEPFQGQSDEWPLDSGTIPGRILRASTVPVEWEDDMTLQGAAVALLVTLLGGFGAYPQHPQMPAGMTHEEHLKQLQKEAALKKRGAEAMGFDQDHSTHHFWLKAAGGDISVEANDPTDVGLRAAIRAHLREIAGEFSRGIFDKPSATHAEVPPGVADMVRLENHITFRYEDLPSGGRVTIRTSHDSARRAIHEFLRYQIKEHATGDPVTVQR